jgi:hypothetical protein
VTDFTVSVSEFTVSVTDFTVSVTDITVSVTDITVSVADITVSVTDITVSVTDITLSETVFPGFGAEIVQKQDNGAGTPRCQLRQTPEAGQSSCRAMAAKISKVAVFSLRLLRALRAKFFTADARHRC